MTAFDTGDKILVFGRAWGTYYQQLHLAGLTPVEVPCDGALTGEIFARSLKPHGDAAGVFIGSPSNPTGFVITPEEREKIAAIGNNAGITMVFDDIYNYQHMRFDGNSVKFGDEEKGAFAAGNIIYINGPSKCFAVTGHRIGYFVGPENFIVAASRYLDHTTSNAAAPQQIALVATIEHFLSHQQEYMSIREPLDERRRFVLDKIKGLKVNGQSAFEPIVEEPQGAFYVFATPSARLLGSKIPEQVRFPDGSSATITGVSGRTVKEVGLGNVLERVSWIGVAPGSAFHDERLKPEDPDPGVRISYAAGMPAIQKAFDRIAKQLLSQLEPGVAVSPRGSGPERGSGKG